jgi:predicted RNA-binding protein with RPS1 domain
LLTYSLIKLLQMPCRNKVEIQVIQRTQNQKLNLNIKNTDINYLNSWTLQRNTILN